jgi:hypothetical protein
MGYRDVWGGIKIEKNDYEGCFCVVVIERGVVQKTENIGTMKTRLET